jgi:hypothetical protein
MQRLTLLLFLPSADFPLTRAPSVSWSGSNRGCCVTSLATRPCWRTSDCASPGGAALRSRSPARSQSRSFHIVSCRVRPAPGRIWGHSRTSFPSSVTPPGVPRAAIAPSRRTRVVQSSHIPAHAPVVFNTHSSTDHADTSATNARSIHAIFSCCSIKPVRKSLVPAS